MDKYIELWNKTKKELKDIYDLSTYNENFEPVKQVYKEAGGYIYLVCDGEFFKNKIEMYYGNRINDILKSFLFPGETYKFKYITKKEVEEAEEENKSKSVYSPEPGINDRYRVGNLKSTNNFNNYVVGESNRFAFFTGMKVAQQPGKYVNPFYIFGNVGLGKTHLAQSIGNFVLDNDINSKILYIKTEDFIEDYGNASRNNNFESFKSKYSDIDILIVDDIQFLSGKQRTQLEFFKLFERLHENNKQIVLTSDKPANELSDMMDRLSTRFAWGMMADIQTPNANHRFEILKAKAITETADPSLFGEDALVFLANTFTEDIRQLESALRRLTFYAAMESLSVIGLEDAKIALEPFLKERTVSKDNVSKDGLSFIYILEHVAKYFTIPISDIKGKSRKKQLAYARQITCYLMREVLEIPYKKIGEILGNRDHSTIMSSCDKIKNEMENIAEVKLDVNNLLKKVQKK